MKLQMNVSHKTYVEIKCGYYVLAFTHRVIIYICINAPGHGRCKIEGIKWSNKIYLEQKLCIIGTEEYNNERMRMNEASMICDKNK